MNVSYPDAFKSQPECMRCAIEGLHRMKVELIRSIREHGDSRDAWHGLLQNLEPLCAEFREEDG